MKVTIEFNDDELEEAKAAMDPLKYKYALDELSEYIRSKLKYEDLKDEVYDELEKIRDRIFELHE